MKTVNRIQLSIALVLVMMSSSLFAGRAEMRLRNSIRVSSGVLVTIKDVAVIDGEDKAFNSSISNLVIAEAIDADHLFVGSFEIKNALDEIGIKPASVDLCGAVHCKVNIDRPIERVVDTVRTVETIKAAKVGKYSIADELKHRVVLSTLLDAEKVTIQFSSINDKFLKQDFDKKRFEIKPTTTVSLGMVRFDITDKSSDKTMRISGTAKYLSSSVAARYSLKAGTILTEENTRMVTRSITRLSDGGVENSNILLGFELARGVRANQLVDPSMVRRMTIVKRSDIVTVTAKVGSISMSMKGVAMGDGAMGDVVSVKVEYKQRATGKYSRAKVISRNLPGIVVAPGEVMLGASTRQLASVSRKDRR